MKITITLGANAYTINTEYPVSAAITQTFNDLQPTHFDADLAKKSPMQAGDFIGDTEQGGSCNVNVLQFNPHCNGTHTESIQHICHATAELSLPISQITPPALMPCVLVSVSPIPAMNTQDEYTPPFQQNDYVITKEQLAEKLDRFDNNQLQSVAVRTLPNDYNKKSQTYNQNNQPPFFTREAILYLNERGVEHLLVDIPSIDRLHDDGLLTCHHLFWQVIEGQNQPTINSLVNKTITELAFFDNQLDDGFYFISLQLTAFENDATPSKPLFYFTSPITAVELQPYLIEE